MSHSLPQKPNLDFLKRQAKELRKRHAEGNPDALHWLKQLHPKLQNMSAEEVRAAQVSLSDVRLVVARAYGFESWPKMKHYIESISAEEDAAVFAFLNAACPAVNVDHRSGNLDQAKAILKEHPHVAEANVYTTAVLGNARLLEKLLAENANRVDKKGGPRNWQPLLYLCFSRFLRFEAQRTPEFVNAAKALLAHGADPNAFFMAGDEKETALYGAAGVANNAAIIRVLLESGAEVNDPDAHYHVAEFDDFECFKLFFEHGVEAGGQTTMLLRKLDFDQIESVRYLLKLGCDPNASGMWGKTALHQAVMRGRSLPFFELLLEHGADVNALTGNGKSVFALAARAGRKDVMKLLKNKGAKDDLDIKDRFLVACVMADASKVEEIIKAHPKLLAELSSEDKSVIVEAATSGKTDAVKLMLETGFEAAWKGNLGATALHWAAWHGWAETVRLLLKYQAPIDMIDDAWRITPLAWAADGCGKCANSQGDYAAVAQALLDAGSAVTKIMVEEARGKMKKILQTRMSK